MAIDLFSSDRGMTDDTADSFFNYMQQKFSPAQDAMDDSSSNKSNYTVKDILGLGDITDNSSTSSSTSSNSTGGTSNIPSNIDIARIAAKSTSDVFNSRAKSQESMRNLYYLTRGESMPLSRGRYQATPTKVNESVDINAINSYWIDRMSNFVRLKREEEQPIK